MKGDILANTNLHFLSFFDNKGEFIWALWTTNPPNYKTGEVLQIAPRIKVDSFPLKRTITAEIKEILHGLEITDLNSQVEFYFKIDITLDVEL